MKQIIITTLLILNSISLGILPPYITINDKQSITKLRPHYVRKPRNVKQILEQSENWIVERLSIHQTESEQPYTRKPYPENYYKKQNQNINGYIPNVTFSIPVGLETAVNFWIKTYTEYDSDQVIIFDQYKYFIYEVISVADINSRRVSSSYKNKLRELRISRAIKNIKSKLNYLSKKPYDQKTYPHLYRLIVKNYKTTHSQIYKLATHNLRFQWGHKNGFIIGLFYAGRFLPHIEKTFKLYGVPIELARLPFVESAFNPNVESSSKGAIGIFQLMNNTVKSLVKKGDAQKLIISEAVDQRLDPIASSYLAASLLKHNYEIYKSWPLATIAYHSGNELANAIKKYGIENMGSILTNYESKRCNFTSINFYPRLLAIIEAEKKAELYFGPVLTDTELKYDVFYLPHYIYVKNLLYCPIDLQTLRSYNPDIKDSAINSLVALPKNYPLKIPKGLLKDFKKIYYSLPKLYKLNYNPIKTYVKYRVKAGDNLYFIAKKFHVSIYKIAKANNLRSPYLLKIKQQLKIPFKSFSRKTKKRQTYSYKKAYRRHIIRKGDNLYNLAKRYKTTTQNLIKYNNLKPPYILKIKQVLKIY